MIEKRKKGMRFSKKPTKLWEFLFQTRVSDRTEALFKTPLDLALRIKRLSSAGRQFSGNPRNMARNMARVIGGSALLGKPTAKVIKAAVRDRLGDFKLHSNISSQFLRTLEALLDGHDNGKSSGRPKKLAVTRPILTAIGTFIGSGDRIIDQVAEMSNFLSSVQYCAGFRLSEELCLLLLKGRLNAIQEKKTRPRLIRTPIDAATSGEPGNSEPSGC